MTVTNSNSQDGDADHSGGGGGVGFAEHAPPEPLLHSDVLHDDDDNNNNNNNGDEDDDHHPNNNNNNEELPLCVEGSDGSSNSECTAVPSRPLEDLLDDDDNEVYASEDVGPTTDEQGISERSDEYDVDEEGEVEGEVEDAYEDRDFETSSSHLQENEQGEREIIYDPSAEDEEEDEETSERQSGNEEPPVEKDLVKDELLRPSEVAGNASSLQQQSAEQEIGKEQHPIITDKEQQDTVKELQEQQQPVLSKAEEEKSSGERVLEPLSGNVGNIEETGIWQSRYHLEQERAVTCEKSLTAMEHHLEKILLEMENHQVMANTSLQQQLKELQARFDKEQEISLRSKDSLVICENTLTSMERHYESLVAEHDKNHSIADTTVVQLHHQLSDLHKQLESEQRASLQVAEHMTACQSNLTATKEHYESIIVDLQRTLVMANTTILQLQQQTTDLQKQLSDSKEQAIALMNERVGVCEKSLVAMEHHFNKLIAEYQTNQSNADASLLNLRQQMTQLQQQAIELDQRASAQVKECTATCQASLHARDVHHQTILVEHEKRHSNADTTLSQFKKQVEELQNQIVDMEKSSLHALHESRLVWEQERQALTVQFSQNLTLVETQWQLRYQKLRNKHERLQQDLEKQKFEYDILLDRFYTTRQEQFTATRALHALQSQKSTFSRYTQRIVSWVGTYWNQFLEHVTLGMEWVKDLIAAATEQVRQLQQQIHAEMEVLGVSALLQRFQTEVLPTLLQHLEKVTILPPHVSLPRTTFYRLKTLLVPGASRFLQLRRQLQVRFANVVRVVTHFTLAYCHVIRVGQSQHSNDWTKITLRGLEWSHRHSEKVVQRTELTLWLLLFGYVALRIKLFKLFSVNIMKKTTKKKKQTKAKTTKSSQPQPDRCESSKPNVVVPAKIRPAFRGLQGASVRHQQGDGSAHQ